jgi:selenocysteine-specific elongation factor
VAVKADGWLLDRAALPDLRKRLRLLVEDHDRAFPLDPGIPVGVAAARLDLPTPGLVPSLVAPPLRLDEGRVTSQSGSSLPTALLRSLDAVAKDLAEHPYAAPTADRLAELGLDSRSVAAAVRAGRLLRLAEGVILLPGSDRDAAASLAKLPQPFTVSEARVELGSSRRVVLPLLAHLDRLGLTRRQPDDRRYARSDLGT